MSCLRRLQRLAEIAGLGLDQHGLRIMADHHEGGAVRALDGLDLQAVAVGSCIDGRVGLGHAERLFGGSTGQGPDAGRVEDLVEKTRR